MKQLFATYAIAFALICSALSASAQQTTTRTGTFRHGISWGTLVKLEGAGFTDKKSSVLTPPLKKLLGARYDDFRDFTQVEFGMKVDDDALVGSGMAPHSGSNRAAVFAFGKKGETFVAIRDIVKKGGPRIEYFGDKDLLENPTVAEAISNWVPK